MIDRRTFVSQLASAGVLAVLPPLSGAEGTASRPRVGLIGCGWYGGVDLASLSHIADIEVVSLCDPNAKALADTLKVVSARQERVPRTFSDYREMLAAEKHDIVIVGTPDHWHALPAIAAMKAGADVFLEKPISVDVMEGEALVAAARKYDRIVQVNLQRRSSPLHEEMRKNYLDTGRLGRIGLVECFYYGGGKGRIVDEVAPPRHLDYDLWAGPAEKVPYIAPIESKGWRRFMEYGNGKMGDMGVHIFDLVRHLMGLGWPISIGATGGNYMNKAATGNIADTENVVFKYPDLDVTWEHRTWGISPIPKGHWTDQWGARMIGERGTLHFTTLGYRFEPNGKGAVEGRHSLSETNDLENLDYSRFDEVFALTDRQHALDFMEARADRTKALSNIEEGHISSASCILANVAMDLGRSLSYDPSSRSVLGDAEATARLARPYRVPWVHPDPDLV